MLRLAWKHRLFCLSDLPFYSRSIFSQYLERSMLMKNSSCLEFFFGFTTFLKVFAKPSLLILSQQNESNRNDCSLLFMAASVQNFPGIRGKPFEFLGPELLKNIYTYVFSLSKVPLVQKNMLLCGHSEHIHDHGWSKVPPPELHYFFTCCSGKSSFLWNLDLFVCNISIFNFQWLSYFPMFVCTIGVW